MHDYLADICYAAEGTRIIIFESVAWKNLLSTGNNWTEIILNKSPTTLIVGHNGAGKSTLVDALSFGLFGKPHRDVKKAQLVNSVNQKGCEVVVKFTIGKVKFKIVRGIKPNKFEIWQNDTQINQDSNARDYQKFLEQNILKLNHKSFHQIVVLGSSSFIPFMQQTNANRRLIIEDILDIGIFSKMNQILKEKMSRLREDLTSVNHELELTKEKISMQRKYVKDISELNAEQVRQKNDRIVQLRQSVDEIQNNNATLSLYIEQHQSANDEALLKMKKKQQQLNRYSAQFKEKMKNIAATAQFFEENDNCPTCSQTITDDIKDDKLSEAKAKAKELQGVMEQAQVEIDKADAEVEELNQHAVKINEYQAEVNANNREISNYLKQISELEDQIQSLTSIDGDLSVAREELEDLVNNRETLSERKIELVDSRSYNEAATEMLKDSGIKTKIIKEYLPAINALVNNYLQVLDFFVSFHLDESFNETIKSRHRDQFSYASFSEGEKMKIDLSLLFTWRQIARMKNSTNTNLLILDETFDSSLDNDGIDNLLKIIHSFDDTNSNCFIISHKSDALDGKFRSKIEFAKEGNFSEMKAES